MSHATHYELALSNMAWESFGAESIIIDFVTGSYFSLSASASDIVRLAASGLPLDGIATALATRYDTNAGAIRDDVAALLGRSVEVGVLRAASAREPSAPDLGPPAAAYAAPLLDKYDDMEEMLLLDPIHDLDDTGWPRAQAAPDQPPARH